MSSDQAEQEQTTAESTPGDAPSCAIVGAFDLDGLAAQVREMESRTVTDFVQSMFQIADMLGRGRTAAREVRVTHYNEKMAKALGRSISYVQKYLRLSEVPAEDRTRAIEHATTFNGLWHALFPSPRPSEREKAKPEIPRGQEGTAPEDAAPDNKVLDVDERGDEVPDVDEPGNEMPDGDEPPSQEVSAPNSDAPVDESSDDREGVEPEAGAEVVVVEQGSDSLLAALGVTTEMDALARITELMQAEYGSQAEIRRLRERIGELEQQRNALMKELDVVTPAKVLAAVKELKAHAAA